MKDREGEKRSMGLDRKLDRERERGQSINEKKGEKYKKSLEVIIK